MQLHFIKVHFRLLVDFNFIHHAKRIWLVPSFFTDLCSFNQFSKFFVFSIVTSFQFPLASCVSIGIVTNLVCRTFSSSKFCKFHSIIFCEKSIIRYVFKVQLYCRTPLQWLQNHLDNPQFHSKVAGSQLVIFGAWISGDQNGHVVWMSTLALLAICWSLHVSMADFLDRT